MANSFSTLLTTLTARALTVLREQAVMTRLINTDLAAFPKEQGDTVNMTIASSLAASDVAPQAAPITPPNSAPTKVTVTLNKWRKAGFHLTDKERGEIIDGIRVAQVDEAIKALANDVNSYIYSLYPGIYGVTGTAGTTPFASDLTDAANARKVLNQQLAPLGDRRVVIDPDAEAKLLANPFIAAAYARGDANANREGALGRIMGMDFAMDQLVPTHTSTAFTAGAVTVNGVNAAGATTVSIAKATNTSPLVAGDIFTIAGNSQSYTVVTGVTLIVGNTNVTIQPPLAVATAGGEVVTKVATHAVNLAFHRDAFAFASRPLQTDAATDNTVSIADPVSRLALRLERVRQHKQDYYEFDILYGCTLVRPELACRILG